VAGPHLVTSGSLGCQGLTHRDIEQLVRRGVLRRVRRGVFSYDPQPGDDHDWLVEQAAAALCVSRPTALICGLTAARLMGWCLPPPARPATLHVLLPSWRGASGMKGVTVHEGPRATAYDVDGVACTDPLRTLLDIAAVLRGSAALAAIESAVCGRPRLLEQARLIAADDRVMPRRGRRIARDNLARATGRSESPLESRAWELWVDAGLPLPEQQAVIRVDGRFCAPVDFLWRGARLVVEVDGLAKYAEPGELQREKVRQNQLVAAGYLVLRFTWDDVTRRPEFVVASVRRLLDRSAAAASG
jgi:very-short-patch-repair endonuclease